MVPMKGERNGLLICLMLHNVAELSWICEAEGKISLLDRLGWCKQTLGQYKATETIYRQLLAHKEVQGEEHPEILASMYEREVALSSQGKHTEAEPMLQIELTLRKQTLG